MCEELKAGCTVQMRRFETLIAALNEDRGDAVIASIAPSPETRAQGRLHRSVLPQPGALRGAARHVDRGRRAGEARGPQGRGRRRHRARGLSQGAVSGSRVAPLSEFRRWRGWRCGAATSTSCSATPSRSRSGSTAPLRRTAACSAAGAYLDNRYFGEGIGIAVRKGNDVMRLALNWALFRVWEQGRFTDLWLRYFPISPF